MISNNQATCDLQLVSLDTFLVLVLYEVCYPLLALWLDYTGSLEEALQMFGAEHLVCGVHVKG